MQNDAIEAAVFRRLLAHLDGRKDVQNIELMILAGFCRNCLSKWYVAEAAERGKEVEREIRRWGEGGSVRGEGWKRGRGGERERQERDVGRADRSREAAKHVSERK